MDYEALSQEIDDVTRCLAKINNATQKNNTYTVIGASDGTNSNATGLQIKYDAHFFSSALKYNQSESMEKWPCLSNDEERYKKCGTEIHNKVIFDMCKSMIQNALNPSSLYDKRSNVVSLNAKKLASQVKLCYESMKEPTEKLANEYNNGAKEFCELAYKEHIENLSDLFLNDARLLAEANYRAGIKKKNNEHQAEIKKKRAAEQKILLENRALEDTIRELQNSIEDADDDAAREQAEKELGQIKVQQRLNNAKLAEKIGIQKCTGPTTRSKPSSLGKKRKAKRSSLSTTKKSKKLRAQY